MKGDPRSRAYRSAFLAFLAASIAFIPVLRYAAAAQSAVSNAPNRAILARGPIPVNGIPYFPPNALPALEGEYRFREATVDVFFTREILYFPAAWSKARYGEASVFELKSGGRVVVAYRDASGYYLILDFPPNAAWASRFLAAFRSRFEFFRRSAKTEADLSFPAVVEVS
jgi:hypothetical protein